MSLHDDHDDDREPAVPDRDLAPRRHRGRRAAVRSALALVLLAVALGAFLVWLVVTAAGARFLFARITDLVPGELSASRIEGPVSGPLILHDFHYRTARFEITATLLRVTWRPWELRRRIIDVDDLSGNGIVVRILPSETTAKRSNLTDINFRYNLVVRALDLRDLRVLRPGDVEGKDARPIVVDRITMDTAAWKDAVRIQKVNVVSPDFDLDVRGWLRPVGDYPLDLNVVWAYRPPEKQPAWAGQGRLSGTLRALRLDQDVRAPFPAAVHGTIAEALFDPRFRGTLDFRDVKPRTFAASSPVTLASGHLVADARGAADFAAHGTGRVTVEGWGTMDVSDLAMSHRLDRWHFDRLTVRRPGAPGTLTWVGDFVVPPQRAARFAGRAAWQRMTWPIDAASPTVRSPRGAAQVSGTSDDYRLVVDGLFSFPNVPEGRWTGSARGNRRELTFQDADGRILGGHVRGSGRVRWKPAVAWTVQATASGIDPHAAWPVVPATLSGGAWKLAGHGDADAMTVESLRVDNAHGTLVATGGVSWKPAFTWHTDAQTHGISPAAIFPQVPPSLVGGDWHVVGSGTDQRADLTTVAGAFLGGSVDAAGRVAWKPAVAWDLHGTAKDLDPAKAFAGWNGRLSGAFRTQATSSGKGVNGEVQVDHVAGTLRERPLAAHGTLLLRQGTMSLAGVEGTWGPGRLALQGEISPALGLGFRIEQLDLAALDPASRGIVTATGTLRGAAAAPVIAAELQGQRIAFRGIEAKRVGGRLAVDLAPGGHVDVDLSGSAVQAFGQAVDTLTVIARGTREAHAITATARGKDVTLDLAASGGFVGWHAGQPIGWSGTVTQLTAQSPQTGRWDLAAPTAVLLSAPEMRVQQLCWVSGGARLCGDLDWRSGQQMQLAATVTELPLKLVQTFLPPDVEMTGTISGEAHLHTGPGGVLLGDAVLRPSPGAALWNATRGEETRVAFEGGQLQLVADAGGVATRADLRLSNGGTLQGSVMLPGFRMNRPSSNQPLQGHLVASFGDLRFVQALVPILADTSGQARADLALSGTLANPGVSGSATVTGAHAAVPRLGLQLQAIDVTASGNGNGPLAVHGSLRSGSGTLTFKGSTPLLPSKAHPLQLDLTGSNVQIANLDTAKIAADPDLQLVWNGSLFRLAGQVVVPTAHVIYKRGKAGAITPSRDVVFVGPEVPHVVETPGMQIDADVRVVLGNDVQLEAEGLRAHMRGSLFVVEDPGQGTKASGQLELVDGTFKAYGQDLTIDRGRLLFAGGSITDPGIDLRAYRKIEADNVTAGITATGTVKAPQVSVWSDPAMGESDALSYLVLGKPMESAAPQQGQLLTSAATGLGLKGGDILAKKIGSALGLEEAGIQTGQTLQDAAFVVGHYFSPRLYLSYGIGLFDAASTLRIRYLVSEHLHIEAQTGMRTSGDVLYTFERGHPTPQEIGKEMYHDLPRVTKEELNAPKTVPVNAEGKQPPPATGTKQTSQVKQQASDAATQNETPPPENPHR